VVYLPFEEVPSNFTRRDCGGTKASLQISLDQCPRPRSCPLMLCPPHCTAELGAIRKISVCLTCLMMRFELLKALRKCKNILGRCPFLQGHETAINLEVPTQPLAKKEPSNSQDQMLLLATPQQLQIWLLDRTILYSMSCFLLTLQNLWESLDLRCCTGSTIL
jgi:hypothetical protein